MRQAKYAQGCVFQKLQHIPQGSAKNRPARNNIIIGAKNNRALHNLYRQSRQQTFEIPGRINIDMRGQALS